MNLLTQSIRRFRALFQKRRVEAEMAEEMRLHLELQTERNRAAGMTAEEARYAARRQFGGVEQVKEICREQRGWVWLELLWKDLRFAARSLIRSPGFTAVALSTFALCFGANLTIFAAVDAILVRALPFPHAERLVTVVNSYPGVGYPRGATSFANYFERRDSIPAFSSLSMYSDDSATMGDAGSPRRVSIGRVTPEFFATLGVPMAMGSAFTDAEMAPGADTVAVITNEFWRTYFNAAPDVLGRTFINDGVPVNVVGVLPAGFRFLSSDAQFYRPMSYQPAMRSPATRHASLGTMIARLAPAASLFLAQTELDALEARLAPEDPQRSQWTRWGYHTMVRSLHADHVREVRPVLLLVQAGAVFLLLIGLVNLENLLLVRASARGREVAVRQALGASRRQIAAHALIEIVLLVVVAGALGLGLAAAGVRGVALLGIDRLPLGATVSLDGQSVAVGLLAAAVSGGILAVPVLWFMLRTRVDPGAQIRTRGETAGRAVQLVRHGFIIVQLSLTFMLLAGSGMLGLSLKRLLDTPLGFNPSSVISGQITLPAKSYSDHLSQAAFVARLLPSLRRLPGVTQVAINNGMPFTGRVAGGVVAVEDSGGLADKLRHAHYRMGVTSDYWAAMGIPLLSGRLLDDADEQRADQVCVVDQALAERYWPGGRAIGHRLSFGDKFDAKNAVTIVGEVESVKQKSLNEGPGFGAVYFPFSKFSTSFFHVIVRAAQPVDVLATSLRKAVLELDPELPVADLRTLQTRVDDSLVARRSPAILAALFAAVALILAAVGTYGVLSYAVAQRRREIGVRMALGAEPGRIGRQFVGLGLRMLVAGALLGLVGTMMAAKAVQTVLYGVPGVYWPVLGGTAAVLGAISLVACWLPARRAAKVDPMVALRCE